MLKTLDRYIDDQRSDAGPLASLRSRLGSNRRFTFLLSASVVVHIVFYAALIKLDSWAMMQAIASGRRPVSVVTLIEIAPPANQTPLRTSPEPLERADLSRLKFDPANADDLHLIPRSPKPAEQRGHGGRLPSSDVIEKQLRASRARRDRDRLGATVSQTGPPATSSIQANRIPQFDEALLAQAPPTPAAPVPPAPSPKQDQSAPGSGSSAAAPAGSRRSTSVESSALGLAAAEGQYMALVRAKIRKANERIMPREWIKDVLRDKVSAEFGLVIKQDGQIVSTRLSRSSGYPVLDDYARQAIYTASPFEGFPLAAGNSITFTVTVYFFPL
ncbi:MAG: TonB C-terminal domain-containing protein [Blastocatellia bacterium]